MNNDGFSLIEILISVAILAILAMLSIRTMSGSQQRESILKAGHQVVDLLRKAQSEAKLYGEFRGVCFKVNAQNQYYMAMYKPQLGASMYPTDNDCTGSEINTGPQANFGGYVAFCTNCDSKVNVNQSVFFDKEGYTTQYDGQRLVYEICLINPHLPPGTRAREVEVGINGDIQLIPQTGQGLYSTVIANQGNCQ